METTDKTGIGLVGLGSIGNVHREVLTTKPISQTFELLAICDKEQKEATLPFYTNYSEFLNHPDIQAVAIATPTHFELAREAIKAGKHVLLEKPPTLKCCAAQRIGGAWEGRWRNGFHCVSCSLPAGG